MLLQDKRGVSEIVGYLLLIVFTVILAAIVFVWLRSYVPAEALNCPDGTSVFVKESSFNDMTNQTKIVLKNNGRFDVAGFFIHATNNSSQEVATIDLSRYLTGGGTNKSGNSVVYIFGNNSMNPGDTRITIFSLPGNITPYSVSIIPVRYQTEDNRVRFVSCSSAKTESKIGAPGVENICVPDSTCLSLGYTQCNPPGWNQSDGCEIGALNCGICSGGQSCNLTGQCETPPASCGDRIIQTANGEQCDNGSISTGGTNGVACTPSYGSSCIYCSSLCEIVTVQGPYCGDGIVQTSNGEQCDTGTQNGVQGSGCTSSCQIVSGYTCNNNVQPSQCSIVVNSCPSYCVSLNLGYSSTNSACTNSPGNCVSNGGTYQSGGDQWCTGGPQADTCCCKP